MRAFRTMSRVAAAVVFASLLWLPAPPAVLGLSNAADAFNRDVANGLGTADVGGPWTTGEGSTADYDVTGSQAELRVTGTNQSRNAELAQVSVADFSATVVAGTTGTATASPGLMWGIEGRRANNQNYYLGRFRVNASGTIQVGAQRVLGGSFTNLGAGWVTVPRESWTTGASYTLKVEMTGASPTTIRVKVWRVGTPEPGAWDLTVTDAGAALQVPGRVGLRAYLYAGNASPRTFTFDNFLVTPLG
jgi:hypothetical protein